MLCGLGWVLLGATHLEAAYNGRGIRLSIMEGYLNEISDPLYSISRSAAEANSRDPAASSTDRRYVQFLRVDPSQDGAPSVSTEARNGFVLIGEHVELGIGVVQHLLIARAVLAEAGAVAGKHPGRNRRRLLPGPPFALAAI